MGFQLRLQKGNKIAIFWAAWIFIEIRIKKSTIIILLGMSLIEEICIYDQSMHCFAASKISRFFKTSFRFIIFNCYAISASFHSSDILRKPLQILVETEFCRIAFQPPTTLLCPNSVWIAPVPGRGFPCSSNKAQMLRINNLVNRKDFDLKGDNVESLLKISVWALQILLEAS